MLWEGVSVAEREYAANGQKERERERNRERGQISVERVEEYQRQGTTAIINSA